MGTSLCPVANCRPLFTPSRPFEESVALIQQTLDGLVLDNADFLARCHLEWNADSPTVKAQVSVTLRWQPDRDNIALYNWGKAEADYNSIWLGGPYGLQISFNADYIDFFDPSYRYSQWLGLQYDDGTPATYIRNEWRRYFRQITRTFGGDRVIYLADNTHPLEKYRDLADEDSFAAMEQQLRRDLGEPKATFAEVLADEYHSYFIDYFTDLD